MQEWIIGIMNDFGYLGIGLLIMVENVFPPIPSEVILTFGGFMTHHANLNVVLVILSATVGSVAGAGVLYKVGTIITPRRMDWIIQKWGWILRVKKSDIEKAEGWFLRHGNSTVFFCRFVPIVRSLISIPAGMARMGLKQFFFYTTMGTLVWNSVLVLLGAFTGENWEAIIKYIGIYSKVILVVLILAAIALLIYLIRRKRKNKTN